MLLFMEAEFPAEAVSQFRESFSQLLIFILTNYYFISLAAACVFLCRLGLLIHPAVDTTMLSSKISEEVFPDADVGLQSRPARRELVLQRGLLACGQRRRDILRILAYAHIPCAAIRGSSSTRPAAVCLKAAHFTARKELRGAGSIKLASPKGANTFKRIPSRLKVPEVL
ncbi:hypothetical protein C8J57DRAFT_1471160 [Mycena rebaudengoi]|nr:hypothetical protein C8J57DRAFT_1471160 [Mycena rebaudengoi]